MNGVVYAVWFKRQFLEMRRYMFETLSMIVSMYGFFLLLFLGARAIGGQATNFGATLAGLVVSYFTWMLAMDAYWMQAQGLIEEAQMGTLEQLAMSPLGLVRVLFARVATRLVFQFFLMLTLLVLMMATTSKWLNLDVISVMPLLILTLLGAIGFGFVAGGLAIVFKRVQSALQIMQVGLLAIIATPPSSLPVLKYLPLSWGTHLIRRVMVDGDSIFEIGAGDLIYVAVNSIGYLAVGIGVFRWLERVARERGLLGHY